MADAQGLSSHIEHDFMEKRDCFMRPQVALSMAIKQYVDSCTFITLLYSLY